MTTSTAHPTRYALETPSSGTSGAESPDASSIGTRASCGYTQVSVMPTIGPPPSAVDAQGS